MKVLAGILVAVVGTLVWALFSLQEARRQMSAQQQSNEVVILDFSNRWDATRRSLDEQKRVNEVLETNLTDRSRQLESLRVEIAGLSTDLARARAETKTAEGEIAKRDTEIAKRDAQIGTLENRNVDLTRQMGDLQTAISGLEAQITEAERKLTAAEGDRIELMAELKRLQDEKIAMEKQLNDLVFVRDQVRKLKEELTIARRLDWIRRGIYATGSRKGGETLSEGRTATAEQPQTTPAPTLDVELRSSGEVRVNAPTNAPPPEQ